MFDKVKNIFGSKPEPKKRVRKSFAIQDDSLMTPTEDAVATEADINRGKELFWGRYPYYPEMSTIYRKLFQKFQIDNSKLIKVYDPICGADMCQLASGSGPNVEYICEKHQAELVEGNIKKLDLGKKMERLASDAPSDGVRKYFAHVFSFYPNLDDESSVNWSELDDNTLSNGYVFLPKLVTNPTNEKKKPSEKLADNIAFYFYIDMDQTNHWTQVLEKKIEILQKETPRGLVGSNKFVIEAFRAEVTKWALLIKQLKSGEIKIVTSVYKHDEIPD